jgi:hypothetical protein
VIKNYINGEFAEPASKEYFDNLIRQKVRLMK